MPNTYSGIIIDDDHNWYNGQDGLDIRHNWVDTEYMFCLQNLTNIPFIKSSSLIILGFHTFKISFRTLLQANIQIHYFNVARSTFGTSFLIWSSTKFTSFMTRFTFTLVAVTSRWTRAYTCPKKVNSIRNMCTNPVKVLTYPFASIYKQYI